MSDKHTPGPWKIHEHGVGFEVECANGNVVAQAQQVTALRQDPMQLERKSNARLIAASPMLLDALKLIANAENSALDLAYCKGIARAAIAKATVGAA